MSFSVAGLYVFVDSGVLLGEILVLFVSVIIALEMSTDALLFCVVDGMVFGLGKFDDMMRRKWFLVGGSRLRVVGMGDGEMEAS